MHIAFALPPPAETGSGGGADYIDGLADGLRTIGVTVTTLRGDDPVFPADAIPVLDGMLLPLLEPRLDDVLRTGAVALIHHVAASAGRDDASREHARATLARLLPRFRFVVATSLPVAQRIQTAFGVVAHAIPPGQRTVTLAAPEPAAPLILSVGVLTRRKGHEFLLRAAARLTDLPWHLVIAGDTQRDPTHPGELRTLTEQLGLTDRVTLLPDPAPDALEQLWRRATIFALATSWEGYPTAVAEALGRGIPVLTTNSANAADLLPPDAGLICPADDAATFGKCLRRLLFDDALRSDMAAAARAAGQNLPRWPDRARAFIDLLETIG